MGYKEDLALSKVFNRVPTYDELAREDYYDPKKIAPGIKREYTRFVMSPFLYAPTTNQSRRPPFWMRSTVCSTWAAAGCSLCPAAEAAAEEEEEA